MQRCQDKDPEGLKLIDPEEDEIAEHLDPCQSVCQPEDEVNICNNYEVDDGNEGAETDEEKEDIEYRTKENGPEVAEQTTHFGRNELLPANIRSYEEGCQHKHQVML